MTSRGCTWENAFKLRQSDFNEILRIILKDALPPKTNNFQELYADLVTEIGSQFNILVELGNLLHETAIVALIVADPEITPIEGVAEELQRVCIQAAETAIKGAVSALEAPFEIRLRHDIGTQQRSRTAKRLLEWMNHPDRIPEVTSIRWKQSARSRTHKRKRKPFPRKLDPIPDPETMQSG